MNRKLLLLPVFLIFFQLTSHSQEGNSCLMAQPMLQNGIYTDDIIYGGLVSPGLEPACINPSPNYPIREKWFKFQTDGISVYYLDLSGIIGSLELYQGSCNSTTPVQCVPTDEMTIYTEFQSYTSTTWYVRVVGYSIPGFTAFDLNLNSVDYTPTCDVVVENVDVYPCVNPDGFIPVTLSGTLTDTSPLYTDVFTEIDTDESFFFTTEIETGNTWTANFLVQGTTITHVYALYGNSETNCVDLITNVALPSETCAGFSTLVCGFEWNKRCSARSVEIWMYDPGTDYLRAHYEASTESTGNFIIENPILGTFDVIVKVDGYLAKGIPGFTTQTGANNLSLGGLIGGDLNGDNKINIVDASILNEWFGMPAPPEIPALDQSCDGYVNIEEASIVNSGYGLIGDAAPLGN